MKSVVYLILTVLTVSECAKFDVTKTKNSLKIINREKSIKAVAETEWWETGTFYQIYPRSFKDSNNDGIGDLQGIIEKLDYLNETGINAIWISPIFQSPQVDQGYDISDYKAIDPIFGTLDDLKQLLDQAHSLGIKVILDFVPNHTSDQHQWFKNSVEKKEGFEDYYIWSDGKIDENGNRAPPNNWISVFKGSAWSWNEDRQQYYLHQFTSSQPDLNLRNQNVINALHDVLLFWLDFGVDGFRVDAVSNFVEDADLRDEPLSNLTGYGPEDYEYLDHIYTLDLNETFYIIYDLRDLLDSYTKTNGGQTRILMTESYSSYENILLYFQSSDETRLGSHIPFNFDFITKLNIKSTTQNFINIISNWMDTEVFSNFKSNWVLGNHDNSRMATRLGNENVDLLNMLTAILPSIQITYNGEEIGQENGEVTCEEGQDPAAIKNCSTFDQTSRDFERTPFQWDDSVNAGFNDGAQPWLPVSKKANETNLAEEIKEVTSHYSIYKSLQEIRTNFINTELHSVSVTLLDDDYEKVLQFDRNQFEHTVMYTLLFNYSDDEMDVFLLDLVGNCTILVVSGNSQRQIGDMINPEESVKLLPRETILMTSDFQDNLS